MLLVDDDPTTLAIVARRLEVRGHVVDARSEAIGTTNAIREAEPDVVVLDVGMPAVNGDRLAKIISRSGSDVKLVLLSDRPDEELEALAMACGAHAYLNKRDGDRLPDLLEALMSPDPE